jgi:subtilisin family serine protease
LTPAGTGKGITIAVVDSGVHAGHPHVGNVAGGVGIDASGAGHADFVDRLGHGTAVAAAIHEKAPDAVLLAVKVFDRALSTSAVALVAAIDWAIGRRVRLVNLSLGTSEPEPEAKLAGAVARAAAAGVLIVAAVEPAGPRWLPGSLPGVVPVRLDWECPRHEVQVAEEGGAWFLKASGYPREIPGVPKEKNIKGLSFAVANATGVLACALERSPAASLADLERLLV